MNVAPLRPRRTAWSTNGLGLVSATDRLTATTTIKNIINNPTNAGDSRTPTPPKPGQITASVKPDRLKHLQQLLARARSGYHAGRSRARLSQEGFGVGRRPTNG